MDFEFGLAGDIRESAVAYVFVQGGISLAIGVYQENVRLSVAVVIDDASAAAQKMRQ